MSTRKEKKKETRELIDTTALKLFVKKGVSATTIRDIAKQAKIAEGTMYRHYDSKSGMAEELYTENMDTIAQKMEELEKSQPTLLSKVTSIVEYLTVLFDNEPVLFQYLFLTQPSPSAEAELKPVQVLRKIIFKGMLKGEIPQRDPEMPAFLVVGMIKEGGKGFIRGQIKTKREDLSKVLVSACWRVITG